MDLIGYMLAFLRGDLALDDIQRSAPADARASIVVLLLLAHPAANITEEKTTLYLPYSLDAILAEVYPALGKADKAAVKQILQKMGREGDNEVVLLFSQAQLHMVVHLCDGGTAHFYNAPHPKIGWN